MHVHTLFGSWRDLPNTAESRNVADRRGLIACSQCAVIASNGTLPSACDAHTHRGGVYICLVYMVRLFL